jgi:hypothetical protein
MEETPRTLIKKLSKTATNSPFLKYNSPSASFPKNQKRIESREEQEEHAIEEAKSPKKKNARESESQTPRSTFVIKNSQFASKYTILIAK